MAKRTLQRKLPTVIWKQLGPLNKQLTKVDKFSDGMVYNVYMETPETFNFSQVLDTLKTDKSSPFVVHNLKAEAIITKTKPCYSFFVNEIVGYRIRIDFTHKLLVESALPTT